MSSLYFGLDEFYQLEVSVPEYDAVFSVECTLYVQSTAVGRGVAGVACHILGLTVASNGQTAASPTYNDISLLIS
jgi:hypothetical protein